MLDIGLETKQKFIENLDVKERVQQCQKLVEKQVEVCAQLSISNQTYCNSNKKIHFFPLSTVHTERYSIYSTVI